MDIASTVNTPPAVTVMIESHNEECAGRGMEANLGHLAAAEEMGLF
jgi:hypothetical protein